jgi:hypothetical protein
VVEGCGEHVVYELQQIDSRADKTRGEVILELPKSRRFVKISNQLALFPSFMTKSAALRLLRTMSSTPTRSHSPPTPPPAQSPPAKRIRLDPPAAGPVASTSALPYGDGLHLAPMVRIGTLPVRLLGAFALPLQPTETLC